MKIHSVSMTGFGPFKATQTVNVDAFESDGIFLISGRTGSGKTSILDAIVYALYGTIPRGGKGVRSDHCGLGDPTLVELEFSTEAGRYRVERAPSYERPKARGTGTTPEQPRIEVFRIEGDQRVGLSTKANEANAMIQSIVGLNGDQFLQVVLLAQGRFQEFLVAESGARQRLLGAIFRTDRFNRYDTLLDERSKSLRDQVKSTTQSLWDGVGHLAGIAGAEDAPAATTHQMGTVEPWVATVLTALEDEVTAATSARSTADAARAAAAAHLTAQLDLAQRQKAVATARAALATLDEQATEVDDLRSRLLAAQRAAEAWACLEADREASRQHERSAEVARSATDAFTTLFGHAPGDDLDALVDSLGGDLATLAEAARLEADLPRLTAEHDEAEAAAAGHEAEVVRVRERRDALLARIEGLDALLAGLEEQLSGRADAQLALATVQQRLAAARKAEAAQRDLDVAAAEAETALSALDERQREESALRRRHLEQLAGHLAGALSAGEPCAVCGSLEHPNPAQTSDVAVSDADLEAVADAVASAQRHASEAQSTVSARRTTLDHHREAAGSLDVDACESAVASAREVVERLDALAQQQAAAKTERATAVTEAASLGTTLDAADAQRAALTQRTATAAAALTAASTNVQKARGEFASVGERVAETRRRHETARQALQALDTLEHRRAAAESAATTLAKALAEHGFADVPALEQARVSKDELHGLERRLHEHDVHRAQARAVLDDPRHQDLPADPVDPAPAQEALAQADEAAQRLHAHVGGLQQRLHNAQLAAIGVRASLATLTRLDEDGRALVSLSRALHGDNDRRMKLETYVLAGELEEIVKAANVRLATMTSGQYALEHDDSVAERNAQSGLGLRVRDHHTGKARSPVSLSGGEKFLASLALALGLAEVVTNRAGGVRLDTLFVDEGFGSLDSETLEVAMRTLDSLREGGRTVGLISHVEAMKEQIPAKLRVAVAPEGWSLVSQ